MPRPYSIYRYAYTAWHGRIGFPVREIWIGEIESRAGRRLGPFIASAPRNASWPAPYPREIKLSRGQFLRVAP